MVETSVTIQGADPRVSPKHVEKIFTEADKQLSPVRGVVVHQKPCVVYGGRRQENAGTRRHEGLGA